MNKSQFENVLLVTGGSGFIGSAFLRLLVPKYTNWFFINLDALTYAGDLNKTKFIENSINYKFIHGNICDKSLVKAIFEDYKVNIVVNFAAESHVDNSIESADEFLVTNIMGTFTLLDASLKSWGPNPNESSRNFKFVQISTDEVYGSLKLEDLAWDEESCIQPNNPYSASKASAEVICRSYFKTFALPVIITRSSNNFGSFQNKEKLIPKTIQAFIDNSYVPIYGDGSNIRDWTYVEDNINAIEIILLRGSVGEIYNISSNNEITNLEIVNVIKSYFPNSTSEIRFVTDRLGHDKRYSLNNNKIKHLGWRPNADFKGQILETIDHYLKSL